MDQACDSEPASSARELTVATAVARAAADLVSAAYGLHGAVSWKAGDETVAQALLGSIEGERFGSGMLVADVVGDAISFLTLNTNDLAHILEQIRIAEEHVRLINEENMNPQEALASLISSPLPST